MVLETNEAEIDYVDGVRAAQKLGPLTVVRTRQVRRVRVLLTWALVVGLLLLLVRLMDEDGGRGMGAHIDFGMLLWLGLFGGTFVGGIFGLNRLVRWAIPKSISRREPIPVRMEVSEEGIRCDSERGWTRYRWSFFDRHTETEKSFVLLGKRVNAAPSLMLVAPKAAFTGEEQRTEFRKMVGENVFQEAALVGKGDAAFPVVGGDATLSSAAKEKQEAGVAGDEVLLENAHFEHGDMAVEVTGWRRKMPESERGLVALILGFFGVVTLMSAGVAAYLMAGYGWPFGLLIMLPVFTSVLLVRGMLRSRNNLAGDVNLWRRHVLSYGPASVIVREEGVLLQTSQVEMLLRPAGVVAAVESDGAFSVVGRQWEIVVPKRLLSAKARARTRGALEGRFGKLTVVEAGRVIRVEGKK